MPHPPIYPARCHLVAALAASRCGLRPIFIIAQQQIPFTISQMAAQGHLSVPAPFVTTDPPFSSNTMLLNFKYKFLYSCLCFWEDDVIKRDFHKIKHKNVLSSGKYYF